VASASGQGSFGIGSGAGRSETGPTGGAAAASPCRPWRSGRRFPSPFPEQIAAANPVRVKGHDARGAAAGQSSIV